MFYTVYCLVTGLFLPTHLLKCKRRQTTSKPLLAGKDKEVLNKLWTRVAAKKNLAGNLGNDNIMRNFMANVAEKCGAKCAYYPPSGPAFAKYLKAETEEIKDRVIWKLKTDKELYDGLPFVQLQFDAWKDKHLRRYIGTNLLWTDPETFEGLHYTAGVHELKGPYTSVNIGNHMNGQMKELGLSTDHIDGANHLDDDNFEGLFYENEAWTDFALLSFDNAEAGVVNTFNASANGPCTNHTMSLCFDYGFGKKLRKKPAEYTPRIVSGSEMTPDQKRKLDDSDWKQKQWLLLNNPEMSGLTASVRAMLQRYRRGPLIFEHLNQVNLDRESAAGSHLKFT